LIEPASIPTSTFPHQHTDITNSGSIAFYISCGAPVANYNPHAPTVSVTVANGCPKQSVASATLASVPTLSLSTMWGHVMPSFPHTLIGLVGKSARNSTKFCNYSNSGPFELWNFHRNFFSYCKMCSRQFVTRSRRFGILSPHQFFRFHESENVPAFNFFCLPLSHILILSRCRYGGNCFE
jgi:hypothetical protein